MCVFPNRKWKCLEDPLRPDIDHQMHESFFRSQKFAILYWYIKTAVFNFENDVLRITYCNSKKDFFLQIFMD